MKVVLRVAQVVGKMVGGGIESVVMNYYSNVDRSCVQFDFLIDSDSTFVPKREIELLGGRVFFVAPYQRVLAYQKNLLDLFYKHKWPIVHSHENSLSVFPLRAAKIANVPVRIAHSHSTSNPEEFAKNALKHVLKTQANRYPTVRFACGQFAGEWLFGKDADFWVMPNAIDLKRFAYSSQQRMALRDELCIDGNALVVLHMGRFVKQKNHMFLIEVFESLLRRRPGALLLLAGDGPLRSDIEREVEDRGISKSIRFLGQRSDTGALYSAADCFCLPSLYEGLPVVSVEAQASGLPIVMSTDVSTEAIITSRAKMLPRSAGPEAWAKMLATIKCDFRAAPLSVEDRAAMKHYDGSVQGLRLTGKYLKLAEDVGIRIG